MNKSNKAYMYLVKLISSRDYSEHKLREKLKTRKFPANEIEDSINEIKNKGYLRENIYTESRVKAFMHKGYSPEYIRQKLALEHLTISTTEIEEVFIEHQTSQTDQIERLVRKKLQGKSDIDYDGENKILRFLISKGHDYSISKKILKTIALDNH